MGPQEGGDMGPRGMGLMKREIGSQKEGERISEKREIGPQKEMWALERGS